MRTFLPFVITLLLFSGCNTHSRKNFTAYVNPFIGTDGHGHTYPGATLPFGMVQLSPDTRKDNWDACSGYHYSDSAILGFSHTHLSGTGVGDYGDIRYMPSTGEIKIRPGTADAGSSGYRSKFSHQKEHASPGQYQVYLEDPRINVELTATARCGFQRYTFPATDQANVIIDLKESVVTESNLNLEVEVLNDHEICGMRKSSGWAENQVIYFFASFSRPFEEFGIANSGELMQGMKKFGGDDIQAFVRFSTDAGEQILVKTGISAVSIEGARKNLALEIPDWDFDQIVEQAEMAWEGELSKIEVMGSDENKIKFYTALYHAFLAPNLFTDTDGQYRGNDGQVHMADGFTMYTVFSLWDTYRALHPLLSFTQPELTQEFINTFIDIYSKRNLLPVWELAGNETYCMIGYHAVPVIYDTYQKGIGGFDAEKAYEAARNSAMQDHFGLRYYKESGYISSEKEGESISKTLEYAYDDWCIAMMAKALGKNDDYSYFIRRAQSYKNLFDPGTGFIRGKRNGMFTEPFDPAEVNFMLTEANTWQYTFYVPQDIDGLIGLMGGEIPFEEKLDEMFNAPQDLSGRQQADITGLIGQYAHGNEPSHHMAYLYNYVGKPHKTQKLVRQIMDNLYGTGPDGLCGNEDCGQMSAWFVLSAMGFYPVTPGSGLYALGSPIFDEVIIHLPGGADFRIKANRKQLGDLYIHSAALNGRKYDRSYLTHVDLVGGGELNIEMGALPNESWACATGSRPVSAIVDNRIVPVPYFKAASATFRDFIEVALNHADTAALIFLSDNEAAADSGFNRYDGPIVAYKSLSLEAYAVVDGGGKSRMTGAAFYKVNRTWDVQVVNPYNSQYTGGGDMALIDGQRGGNNFRTGSWQGYQGVDLVAVIDLGELKQISSVSASFLQDQRSWIFFPTKVEISGSVDGKAYMFFGAVPNVLPDDTEEAIIHEFSAKGIDARVRYLKVTAKNRGICPAWHPGAGGQAWIFADEIIIE
jgi:predicted alpha-1,2-mannosidase